MQVNFDERDAEALDIEKYADYLASIKAQATYLSITNQTAFYPTKIPDLITSRWLNGRDFFGECVKALRARTIRILGRLSIDLAPTAMVEKHPDWFLRNKDGAIPDRGGLPGFSPRFKPTCQFTSYYSEFIPQVIEEVVTRYDIDAVYSNGWPGTNATICYCQACQKIGDPTTLAYKQAYLERAKALWSLYDGIVTRHKPNMFFTGNLGGGFSGGDLDLKNLTEYAAWFVADNQGRGGYGAPAWDAAQQGRIAKAIMTERLVPNATGSYGICGEARWRGSVTGNPIEVRSRLYQTLATGTTMFVTWINGTAGFKEDRRWQEVIRPVFLFQAANDKHFHTKRSIASVALLVGQRSNRLYKEPPGTSGLDSINGMYQILTEARIPFDVILESDLVPERSADIRAGLVEYCPDERRASPADRGFRGQGWFGPCYLRDRRLRREWSPALRFCPGKAVQHEACGQAPGLWFGRQSWPPSRPDFVSAYREAASHCRKLQEHQLDQRVELDRADHGRWSAHTHLYSAISLVSGRGDLSRTRPHRHQISGGARQWRVQTGLSCGRR